jgi:hypothetical protein
LHNTLTTLALTKLALAKLAADKLRLVKRLILPLFFQKGQHFFFTFLTLVGNCPNEIFQML